MEALLCYNSGSESDEESPSLCSTPCKRSRRCTDGVEKEDAEEETHGFTPPGESDSNGLKQVGSRIANTQSLQHHHSMTESSIPDLAAVASNTVVKLPTLSISQNGQLSQGNLKHQGRVRRFPHVEGNFATHVYIPVKVSKSNKPTLARSLQLAKQLLPELQPVEKPSRTVNRSKGLSSSWEPADSYHISLSRTVPIKFHQIESLVAMLKEAFLGQKRFAVKLEDWQAYLNDDGTRSFLALGTTLGTKEICEQVRLVNEAFVVHELPTFYKEPRPHVSLAWSLGDRLADLKQTLKSLDAPFSLNESLPDTRQKDHQVWGFEVTRVECKVGKRVYVVWSC